MYKVTVQSKGRSFLGPDVQGYEIHMGRTDSLKSVDPFITKEDGHLDGAVSGRVAGTYFHGLFDNADFTTRFLSLVAESRRLEWRPETFRYSKEEEYDRLAAVVREHVDMERIYQCILTSH
jgi:adenosylcobyric acid synthase